MTARHQAGAEVPEAEAVQDRRADELLPLRGGGHGDEGQGAT